MRNIRGSVESICLQKPWLKPVYGDLFDISKRIRKIDDGYFIVRNVLRHKYEVHNIDTQKNSTYEFTIPYDVLDARTISFCQETAVANTEKLLEGIEKHNKAIENNAHKKLHNELEARSIELANDLRRAI